jgi:ketosteroid isomerase-like protein
LETKLGSYGFQLAVEISTTEVSMAAELEPVVRRLFADFDRLDFDAIGEYLATGAQGVDEISRRWLRETDEIAVYFAALKPMLADVKSSLGDIHEVVWADTGLVTFWLEQSYLLDGNAQQVSAPTTIVFRREDGNWRIALIHSVPLPAEA